MREEVPSEVELLVLKFLGGWCRAITEGIEATRLRFACDWLSIGGLRVTFVLVVGRSFKRPLACAYSVEATEVCTDLFSVVVTLTATIDREH